MEKETSLAHYSCTFLNISNMKVLVVASVLVATASAATINQRAIDPGCNAKYPFQYWPNIELCCDYFGLSSVIESIRDLVKCC